MAESLQRRELRWSTGTSEGALPQVLKLDDGLRELAESLKDESSLLVFGRGYNYATALEAALKVQLAPADWWADRKSCLRRPHGMRCIILSP